MAHASQRPQAQALFAIFLGNWPGISSGLGQAVGPVD
jgi:hypothetical protein